MIKNEEKIARALCNICSTAIFLFVVYFLFPSKNSGYPVFFVALNISIVMYLILLMKRRILSYWMSHITYKGLHSGETEILLKFIERIKKCYSYEDFFQALSNILEIKGSCSVVYIDSTQNYVMYNSSDKIATNKNTIDKLTHNFPKTWSSGVYYLDKEFGLKKSIKDSFGVFICQGGYHLFIIGFSPSHFDPAIFPVLSNELKRFQSHAKIISEMGEIAAISRDWKKLAEVQKSFLPQKMPEIKGLQTASYFKPLVNVSGDFYSVLPVDSSKTLLVLGDVSGKGLASALVMGVALNTIKCFENKEDLPGMIIAIDAAIKQMQMQDKYTVLFLGLIDTKKMTISYVNASVADAMILSQNNDGIGIKTLESNCCILGLIDLFDVEAVECPLKTGDVLFLSSDGVSEARNANGKDFGDSSAYLETLTINSSLPPQDFLSRTALAAQKFCNNKLKDDITMLTATITGA